MLCIFSKCNKKHRVSLLNVQYLYRWVCFQELLIYIEKLKNCTVRLTIRCCVIGRYARAIFANLPLRQNTLSVCARLLLCSQHTIL